MPEGRQNKAASPRDPTISLWSYSDLWWLNLTSHIKHPLLDFEEWCLQLTSCEAGPLRPVNDSLLTVGARGSTLGALIGHGLMGIRVCSRKKLEHLHDQKKARVIFVTLQKRTYTWIQVLNDVQIQEHSGYQWCAQGGGRGGQSSPLVVQLLKNAC